MERAANIQQQQWNIALQNLRSAIEILDRWEAPAHIAAHVDLAIHQLQDVLGQTSTESQSDQIVTNAEPH